MLAIERCHGEGRVMLNLQELIIRCFVDELKETYHEVYGYLEPQYANVIAWTGWLALENIATCDALYHNVDHTIMVVLAGQAILRGKHVCDGGVTPEDWLHYTMALLCHDIGYVKGVCRSDGGGFYATGIGDDRVKLPEGGTAVALTPYHVDRSKLFVRERFGDQALNYVDAERIASLIEMTRFPVPEGEFYQDTTDCGGLVRAADFVGQLGDPNYLRKIPALFYEFEETGANEGRTYKTPGDMRRDYAKFYWEVVSPYIQDALAYLRVTQEGKQWVANLHSHVFDIEHEPTYLDF
jgi:hypothetical protein